MALRSYNLRERCAYVCILTHVSRSERQVQSAKNNPSGATPEHNASCSSTKQYTVPEDLDLWAASTAFRCARRAAMLCTTNGKCGKANQCCSPAQKSSFTYQFMLHGALHLNFAVCAYSTAASNYSFMQCHAIVFQSTAELGFMLVEMLAANLMS